MLYCLKQVENNMQAAFKYKQNIINSFYLDDDDITVRRCHDDLSKGKYKKDEVVKPYKLRSGKDRYYHAIWLPTVGATIPWHWIVTILRGFNFDENSVIDHIDGDRMNNHRDNLRITTQFLNNRNREMQSNNNTGYTGISYRNDLKRYIVRKTIYGKRINKSHKTLEGAIEILRELEELSLQDGYTERHGLKSDRFNDHRKQADKVSV